MKLTIEHTTHYKYEEAVRQSIQYLRLTPHDTNRQKILNWELDLPCRASESTDGYGNVLHVITLDEPHDEICIQVRGEVEIDQEDLEDDDYGLSPLVYLRNTDLTEANNTIKQYADSILGNEPSLASLKSLMTDLLKRMPYSPGSTEVYESASDVFAKEKGVCQDHSHVFLAACRHKQIPARYVSGYLYTPDTHHAASHAWVEAWLDGTWHTFDVTNGLTTPSQHLKLAVGLDYLDACPVRGVRFGGGNERMSAVAKVDQTSRCTVQQ